MNLFLKTNAIRGVIAAAVCAVAFVIIGLVVKFRYRQPKRTENDTDDDGGNERNEVERAYYDRQAEIVQVNHQETKTGVDNPAMEHE